MESRIAEIAERIRALRESENITESDMAEAAGVSVDEYIEIENGNKDFSFTFLHKCAERLGVEMTELLTGESPKLSGYTVVRNGKGLPMRRRDGFDYSHLSSRFKKKAMETFVVFAPYSEKEQDAPITLSRHEGQEFDYVLEGSMRFVYEKHTEILNAGDSVYYDSGRGHGMSATSKDGCRFIAVILKKDVRP